MGGLTTKTQKQCTGNETGRYNCWNLAGSPILTQELPQNKPCVLTLCVLMRISIVLGKCIWINMVNSSGCLP